MSRPNVLFIVCDQLRYDSVGFSGIHPVKTPNLDTLAREGLFYENAFSPLPVCAPSRQAMLTGVQPDSIGALFNYNFINTAGADPAVPTWVSELKEAGYRCAYVGSWDASPNGGPEAFGYEYLMNSDEYMEELARRYPDVRYENGILGCSNPVPFEETKTAMLCQAAAGFIRESAGSPWHIWVDLTDPHLPCRPSAPFDTMYRPEDMAPWPGFGDELKDKPYIQHKQIENWDLKGKTWAEFAPVVARYFGMISQTDAAIGTVLDALRTSGQDEETLIIMLSDHGDTCGDHGMMDKHYILYDCVVHVPFIVRPPRSAGMLPASVSRFVSSSLDVAPTVEYFCGLKAQSARHGRPAVSEGDGGEPGEYAVFTSNGQQFGLFTQRGIRTKDYKYIWNLTDVDEFYDLRSDPGEVRNLIGDPAYRPVIAELGRLLFTELERRGDPFAHEGVRWQCGNETF